jgi:phospholipid transport system substrate-binding protein
MKLERAVAPIVAAACFLILPGAAPAAPAATGPALAAAPASEAGPQELMNEVAKRMFDALDANRAAIRKDGEKVYPLVDEILLPHFDTEYAAQLVLAQHWRAASPEQRTHFVSALYGALLRTYGAAIGDFTADRLKILPYRGESPATATQATVYTLVRRSSGVEVPVDYRMRRTPAGWKAFDVVIEGISYVRNYRNDLGEEITQKGLDEVIARLEKETLDLKTSGAARAASAR